MASLLSASEISSCTGDLISHFDTFARDIVIYKAPKFIPSNDNIEVLAGYSNPTQYASGTTEIQSGVYPAIRLYKNDQPTEKLSEVKGIIVGDGKVRIKVQPKAKEFIESGVNDRIVVDGFNFLTNNEPFTQNYLGLVYYIYTLEASK